MHFDYVQVLRTNPCHGVGFLGRFGYDAGRSVRYSLSLRKKFSEYSSPLQEKQEPVQKLF